MQSSSQVVAALTHFLNLGMSMGFKVVLPADAYCSIWAYMDRYAKRLEHSLLSGRLFIARDVKDFTRSHGEAIHLLVHLLFSQKNSLFHACSKNRSND